MRLLCIIICLCTLFNLSSIVIGLWWMAKTILKKKIVLRKVRLFSVYCIKMALIICCSMYLLFLVLFQSSYFSSYFFLNSISLFLFYRVLSSKQVSIISINFFFTALFKCCYFLFNYLPLFIFLFVVYFIRVLSSHYNCFVSFTYVFFQNYFRSKNIEKLSK